MSIVLDVVRALSYGNSQLIKQSTEVQGTCYCPVHENGGESAGHKTPSLGVWKGDQVPLVVKCRSQNCDPKLIIKKLRDLGLLERPVRTMIMRAKECDIWRHPITSDLLDSRPVEVQIGGEQRKITSFYQYTNKKGQVIFFRARIDYINNGIYQKQIRPLAYYEMSDGTRKGWGWKEPPETPLYHLHLLYSHPEKPVLLVEGEKTATAAQHIYPDYNAISVCNPKKTDFSELKNKRVVIFPDNDTAGKKTALRHAKLVREYTKDISIVPIWNFNVPRKWDLADPLPDGCTHAGFFEHLIIPDQLEIDVILTRCEYVSTRQFRNENDLNDALSTSCKEHSKDQLGEGKWAHSDNCCVFCPSYKVIERPRDLLQVPEIFTDNVFIRGENRFLNIRTGLSVLPDSFNSIYAGVYGKKHGTSQAKAVFTESADGRQVDRTGFFPGKGYIYEEEGQLLVNRWSRPPYVPKDYGGHHINPFHDLCGFLFNGIQDELVHVLDWMAFILQNPGKTINWGIVISGVQGCGKDSLVKPLKYLLGESNCTEVSEVELGTPFWAFGEKHLAIFEETKKRGEWELYNRLKAYLTNDKIMIHRKGVQAHYISRVTNYIMVTNSETPMPIEKQDRRWMIIRIPLNSSEVVHKTRNDPNFFIRFHNMCEDKKALNTLLDWFMKRDISHFSPTAHAPNTGAKQILIRESMTNVEYTIDELLRTRDWPFYNGVFTIGQLTQALNEQGVRGASVRFAKPLGKDTRFEKVGRARRTVTIGDGKRLFDSHVIWRITARGVVDIEDQRDKEELSNYVEMFESILQGRKRTELELYDICFDGNWVNGERTPSGHFLRDSTNPSPVPLKLPI